ncbi:hypothetical protein [Streptomyces sp. NPDC047123]|uniref:hypothetical protein n=1 Tax=Streptomyces sp. NPDC047123 TaxID=3155622 RepID=UPI0033E99C45
MNKRTRIGAAAVSGLAALSVGVTGVSQAYAAGPAAGGPSALAEQVTEDQIDELAGHLAALDRGEHLDADGAFDYEATKARFGAELADALRVVFPDGVVDVPEGVQRSYASCLMAAVGLGGVQGVVDKVKHHIEKKNWRKVAEIGLKEAAKRGIKIAGKGGVAGMATALAVAAIGCIWAAPQQPGAQVSAAQEGAAGFVPVSFAGRDAASFAPAA